ncbi:MAG TPA: DCC1-like thiol-disulfide oxidoreductase family protein [Thermoplasmata archaeon]|nr:DCC1-like thiol-disulfide oxidoreductase family protein [Thermoplasmata archaeon]
MPQAYLLYDDGCRVCTAAKDLIARFDTRRAIECLGLQSERARRLAAGIPEERYWGTFHVVARRQVRSGADAFEEILGILPVTRSVRKVMDTVPPARSGARGLYDFAVKLRGDLRCEHRARSPP